MSGVLLRKLEALGPLPEADRTLVGNLDGRRRSVDPRTMLANEGDRPGTVRLMLDGFACRSKVLADGSRQIVACLIPGDFCDLHERYADRMDHSIASFTPCVILEISPEKIVEMMGRPALARAMHLCTAIEQATLRQWLVNLGRREAVSRMAHFFCEIHARMQAVGLVANNAFQLPLTQTDLGDTLGLSAVHVNRSLQQLRADGLVSFHRRELVILDPARLEGLCGFDGSYLRTAKTPPS